MRPNPSHKTTLYVDTENLGGPDRTIREKAELVARAVTGHSWPPTIPEATMIKAYCNNGESARWEEAIRMRLGRPIIQGGLVRSSPLEIAAPEVQRFGSAHKPAANAMDITLMLDTLSDLLTQQTRFAVIISNDSDYGHLLHELRKLELSDNLDPPYDINGLPLLILTHDQAGLSEAYRELSENVRSIADTPQPSHRRQAAAPPFHGHRYPEAPGHNTAILRRSILDSFTMSELVRNIAAGIGIKHWNARSNRYEFTAYHAHRSISGQHPDQAATAEEMQYQPRMFGDWFHQHIWPNMGKYGVTSRREPSGRITYAMDPQTWLRLRNR